VSLSDKGPDLPDEDDHAKGKRLPVQERPDVALAVEKTEEEDVALLPVRVGAELGIRDALVAGPRPSRHLQGHLCERDRRHPVAR